MTIVVATVAVAAVVAMGGVAGPPLVAAETGIFGSAGVSAGGAAAVSSVVPIGSAIAVCNIYLAKNHAGKACLSSRNKHEDGQTRKQLGKGGEKSDKRRKPNPDKRRIIIVLYPLRVYEKPDGM